MTQSWWWFALVLVSACDRSAPTSNGCPACSAGTANGPAHQTAPNPKPSTLASSAARAAPSDATPPAIVTPRQTDTEEAPLSRAGAKHLPARCSLPPDSGPCLGFSLRFRHDSATGICRPFIYGLCGGNANNFSFLTACQDACPGGTPNFDSCDQASDCELGLAPGIGMDEVVACCHEELLEGNELIAYAKRHAKSLHADCRAVPCDVYPPATETPPTEEEKALVPGGDPLQSNPALQRPVQRRKYFVPVCRQHECAVLDIRDSNLSACTRDSDCKLRDGAECCEGNDGHGIVAVAKGNALERISCAAGQRCPQLEPHSLHSLRAQCVDRHCQVVAIPPSWRELTGR